MPKALLGKKLGMTRVYDDQGRVRGVTVIEAGPCAILDVMTKERNGYEAVQLGFEDRFTGEQWETVRKKAAEDKLDGNLKGLRKPELGRYLKGAKGVSPKRFVREVKLADGETPKVGETVTVSAADAWKKVDVTGVSKGKGFQGTMKAWNFSSGPNTHGTKNRRKPGSIGSSSTLGRVVKGKRMYTRVGNEQATMRNLNVVKVDQERNLILVEGSVPGPNGAYVVVRKAIATKVAQ